MKPIDPILLGFAMSCTVVVIGYSTHAIDACWAVGILAWAWFLQAVLRAFRDLEDRHDA